MTKLAGARSEEVIPACLVLHGLGGGPYELDPLSAALRERGHRVLAPVLPGHEGPGPTMPHSCWTDWAEAADAAYESLTETGQPVAVIGFSTGATLALELASRRPVSRMVLLAPFLAIRYTGLIPLPTASYLRLLARIMPDVPRRSPAVRDAEMRRRAAGTDRFRTFSIPSALSALELIDRVKPLVPSITAPTLIIQGRLDTVIEPANAAWLHENLGAGEKELIHLARTDHLVALDRERDQVVQAVSDFLARPTKGPGSS